MNGTGPSKPRVRVVVVNWNAAELTEACLRSLAATSWPEGSLEIVVVDNASAPDSLEALRQARDKELTSPFPLRVVESKSNVGFAEGCNLGIRLGGDHELVALINNDAVVEPGWLEELHAVLDGDLRVGAACPKILLDTADDAGKPVLNNVGNGITEAGEGYDIGLGEPDEGQLDEPTEVAGWCGGGVLLRRAYLDDVGLFDPRFFTYYEDLDLSRRGSARGWIYRTAPGAVLHHRHGGSIGIGSDTFVFHTTRNHLLCTARNGSAAEMRQALAQFRRMWIHHFRTDVFGRARRRQRVDGRQTRLRTSALVSFLWHLPALLRSRSGDRSTLIGRRTPRRPPRPFGGRR